MITRSLRGSSGQKLLRKACEKVKQTADELTKALKHSDERVLKTFTGISLDHSLPLLTSFMHTENFHEFGFAPELYKQNVQKLESILKDKKGLVGTETGTELIEGLQSFAKKLSNGQYTMEPHETAFLRASLLAISRAYPALNKADKIELKEQIRVLDSRKEGLTEDVRITLDKLKSRINDVDSLDNSTFTKAYFDVFGVSNYLDTEKAYEIAYDSEYDCINLHHKEKDTIMSLFKLGMNDPVSQIMNIKKHFENCEQIDSLVIDQSPITDIKRFKKSNPSDTKMYEYSQNLINDWPYLYKFHGKPELRNYYYSVVFDSEYYEETPDKLFNYKFDKHTKLLDVNNTILAYWMGYGDRTATPSLYLSSFLPEERVIEAVYRVDNAKAYQLSELFTLYNIVGGLRLLQEGSKTGCSYCGGSFDNKSFFLLLDKMYRAEYESEKLGSINSSIALECMARLPPGSRGVQIQSTYSFDRSLPALMEKIRQTRLSGLDPLAFSRPEHIKGIYNATMSYKDTQFYEKLALVETVLGSFEMIIHQFIDLIGNEKNLLDYQQIKHAMSRKQVLQEWSPSFADENQSQFCGVEHVVLPTMNKEAVDAKVPKVYEIESRGQKVSNAASFLDKINKKMEHLEATRESDKESQARGRKIKLKAKPGFIQELDEFQAGFAPQGKAQKAAAALMSQKSNSKRK